jgi:uncharacterized protein YodC (DUF2158 family)
MVSDVRYENGELIVERVESKPLAVGDPVRLKSGGPCMTVHHVVEGNTVKTRWHDRDPKIQTEIFPAATLVLCPSGPSGCCEVTPECLAKP